jgi:hypothetical protein
MGMLARFGHAAALASGLVRRPPVPLLVEQGHAETAIGIFNLQIMLCVDPQWLDELPK